jgi:hypothetical protein
MRWHNAVGLAINITRQPFLPGFKNVFGPFVVKTVCDVFAPTKRGNAVFAAHAIQNDTDILFSAVLFAGMAFDVLEDPLDFLCLIHVPRKIQAERKHALGLDRKMGHLR